MNMIELIESALKENDYDGLFVPGVCGCVLGDLSPGSCISEQCEAGYRHTHSQRPNEWIVSRGKEAVTDADIERCMAECG